MDLDILAPFLKEPRREFGVREAAKSWRVAPATAAKRLRLLERERYLESRPYRNLLLFRAAKTPRLRLAKLHATLLALHDSGLIEALNVRFWDPAIVLFGSAARGEDIETSDIDLAVFTRELGEFDASAYAKPLGRRISLHVHRSLSGIANEHLKRNVLNGIAIAGDAGWISESAKPSSGKSRPIAAGRRASASSRTRKSA